jgi:hypothetical protein
LSSGGTCSRRGERAEEEEEEEMMRVVVVVVVVVVVMMIMIMIMIMMMMMTIPVGLDADAGGIGSVIFDEHPQTVAAVLKGFREQYSLHLYGGAVMVTGGTVVLLGCESPKPGTVATCGKIGPEPN